MCNGAKENQAPCCDPYGLESLGLRNNLYFWSAPASLFLLLWDLILRSENSNAGADQK